MVTSRHGHSDLPDPPHPREGGQEDKSNELAKAITGLPDFTAAIEAAAKKLRGNTDVNVALALQILKENTLGEIIKKLAEGLEAFIGYGGGQGIALVIDPLHQLRKGVLEFLRVFLEKLRGLNVNVDSATEHLNKAFKGKDNVSFETAIEKVKDVKDVGNKIDKVVKALKDVDTFKSKNSVQNLADGFKKYLEAVLNAVKGHASPAQHEVGNICSELQKLLVEVGKHNEIKVHIAQVKEAKTKLNAKRGRDQVSQAVIPAITMGTESFLNQVGKDGYKSSYQSTSNWDASANKNTIAQIFLGCLPLYYYWLTYLYWKCKQTRDQGGWEGHNFARPDLKHFMLAMGYNSTHLTRSSAVKGSNIATLLERFDKLKDSIRPSHTDLLTELKKKLDEALNASVSHSSGSTTSLNDNSLSALFYLCRGYFTGKQITRPVTERRPPTSIREMLYWLSGLQFSPHYSDIEKQIDNVIPAQHGLPVADSAIPASTAKSTGDTLTQSQMKGFLLSSCLSAPGVLGVIQGNSADIDGEPWLYSLFCNSMNLQYPSGPALFGTLANYAYALQFQLLFLYAQCRSWYSQSLGWQWCRYGQGVNTLKPQRAALLASWICKAPDCGLGHSCQHNSDRCQHIKECGQPGSLSPLQAFLTDNLNGFSLPRQPVSDSTHHLDNHPPGSMCHVPMGFASALTTDTNATGWHIYYLLDHFCGFSYGPLRELSEKLGCLTKRTPRTLGDLFGFLWRLNSQLFKQRPTPQSLAEMLVKALGLNSPPTVPGFLFNILKNVARSSSSSGSSTATVLSRSLEAMAPAIPFLYQLFMMDDSTFLPGTLFDLTQHCHKKEPVNVVLHNSSGGTCALANDLWSLYQPVLPKSGSTDTHAVCRKANCGGYLYPLTHTFGSAFAPKHASSYLSWVLYLADDLEIGLQEMLDAFKNIDCQTSGCQKSCKSHLPGQHGTSADCSCDSVVHCAGVLPLYYEYGFTMFYASTLKTTAKRTCRQFHNQLKAVIEGNPVKTIITAVDEFLYMFRFYFFYNLSTFWILYVCIVLYIYFYRADLLHLKSHVHFPSSHGIPSIGLLPTGKPTVMTKFTKLTYFMP
ncbi:variant erythrocyte surface antigen-1 family protein [Babesia caballi]|uniref:Variant erythrocyte surface antigen-1 family protein n=1 Tax=Babesia caballi TaxID=5871 RepID=A0AAV4LQT0_BABCB|nr:variant erythrocyte surface antigen-1 family protein [Babesia caballi]